MEKSPVDLAARHILPTLALCVFVNIVDRTNVGIAALNMRADIGLSASAYGMGAGLFYIGFFFAGVPANLLLARIGARRWIAALLVAWGLIAIATGFISDAGASMRFVWPWALLKRGSCLPSSIISRNGSTGAQCRRSWG
ncbi:MULTISPECIES: MFS transporter [unclassified Sphingobium]|uniref:Uncharacterized protein n=1 Tax=Sphingobium fuliginis (strain ATCC 27551) TaxID=336203 RepID=A0ABQ1EST5_SPHSA|nr:MULTISPECIES: MFS transporter [unclassified Sphingobium]WDA36789.1 hypothetical protein PO876_00800 [Sphingobium sp. YC-XJ3]GFZ84511.1 hypothetical protein GCM10019071_11540 [Sphingobium fuliginis]